MRKRQHKLYKASQTTYGSMIESSLNISLQLETTAFILDTYLSFVLGFIYISPLKIYKFAEDLSISIEWQHSLLKP